MFKPSRFRFVIAFAVSSISGLAQAIDTDIFVQPQTPNNNPNVMLLIDNSANENSNMGDGRTRRAHIAQGIHTVLNCLGDNAPVNLGMAGFAGGNSTVNSNFGRGGKIHWPLTTFDGNLRDDLQQKMYKEIIEQPEGWYTQKLLPPVDGKEQIPGYEYEDPADFDAFLAPPYENDPATPAADRNGDGKIDCFDIDYRAWADPEDKDYKDYSKSATEIENFDPQNKNVGSGPSGTGCPNGDKSSNLAMESLSNAPVDRAFYEIWRYFGGKSPVFGKADGLDYKDDCFVSPEGGLDDDKGYDSGTDLYIPPAPEQCGTNVVIYIATGGPTSKQGVVENFIAAEGGDASIIDLPNTIEGPYPGSKQGNTFQTDGNQSDWTDEMARHMRNGDANGDPSDGDQPVRTFVIHVAPPENTREYLETQTWLQSVADEDGYFIADDAQKIVDAFLNIFDAINAKPRVFASTALPVSVNVRGTNLNQVYLGVFRPDVANRPSWRGNLKLYQLGFIDRGLTTERVALVDKNGVPARDEDEGFIKDGVTSFWSRPSTYWGFDGSGMEDPSDAPDGPLVEKGGIAQGLRQNLDNDPATSLNDLANRKVYTCAGLACVGGADLTLQEFSAGLTGLGTVEKAALCAGSTKCTVDDLGDATNLISWVRGGVPGTSVPRPGLHGDVLHSSPQVINYNRNADNDDVVVFYGTNSGTFHAVQGGTSNPSTTVPTGVSAPKRAGEELWSFVAEEHFGKLGQHYDNEVFLPDAATGLVTTKNRNIYFDGGITSLVIEGSKDGRLLSVDSPDLSDGSIIHPKDRVLLFISFRRGGSLLYALDVTDPTAPKFLWRKTGGLTSIATASGGYEEMGETWSNPTVSFLKGRDRDGNLFDLNGDGFTDSADESVPVLIFGKGYSPATDDDLDANDDMDGGRGIGTGIMVVRALDGTPIWQAGPTDAADIGTNLPGLPAGSVYDSVAEMQHSIPSEVRVVDRGISGSGLIRDGFADFLYVGDTGGNLWKVDLRGNPADTDTTKRWSTTLLATLGDHSGGGDETDSRRFLFPPDVVLGSAGDQVRPFDKTCGAYDAILIGSGNREEPRTSGVQDRFYHIKDHSFPGNTLNLACASTDPKITLPYEDLTKQDDPDSPSSFDASTVPDLDDADFYDATNNDVQDGASEDVKRVARESLDQAKGWYINLDAGEKVVSSSVTVGGAVFFSTNLPKAADDICASTLGDARSYALDFADASGIIEQNDTANLTVDDRWGEVKGGGFPPSPVPAVVDICDANGDCTKRDVTLVGTVVLEPPGDPLLQRERVYRYFNVDED